MSIPVILIWEIPFGGGGGEVSGSWPRSSSTAFQGPLVFILSLSLTPRDKSERTWQGGCELLGTNLGVAFQTPLSYPLRRTWTCPRLLFQIEDQIPLIFYLKSSLHSTVTQIIDLQNQILQLFNTYQTKRVVKGWEHILRLIGCSRVQLDEPWKEI